MRFRRTVGAAALAGTFMLMIGGAAAFDEAKYPDLKGQWRRVNVGLLAGGAGGIRYDTSNPPTTDHLSLGQKPPLTPEYQSIYDENLEDMAKGGQGIDPFGEPVRGTSAMIERLKRRFVILTSREEA